MSWMPFKRACNVGSVGAECLYCPAAMPVVLHMPFPLLFLYWYGILTSLSVFNFALWVRFQHDDVISFDLRWTYFAFCLIGTLAYVFAGGPMFFFGYKYSATQKARDKKVRIGLCVSYFTSTLPMFLMDLFFVWDHGILHVLQGVVFVLQLISWSTGSFAVWFIYMWQVAKVVHTKKCGGRQLVFEQQNFRPIDSLKPPLGYSTGKALPGQPAVI